MKTGTGGGSVRGLRGIAKVYGEEERRGG